MSFRYLRHVPGVAAGAGYSHAIAAEGGLIVVSGQISVDAQGQVIGAHDAPAQIEQAFRNLETILSSANATFTHVIKLGFYLTSRDLLPSVRAVRDRYIDIEQPPASTLVIVAGLVRPELVFEVDALAVVPH
jgi:enamine deaminase RidA (YjgF/YER057c/UK114 family)